MHIKEIRLLGFRRFTDLTVTGLPSSTKLVILAGPNGNGKSSLFDSFLSFHHHELSELGFDWNVEYHQKQSNTEKLDQRKRVKIEFYESLPKELSERRKVFYVRSAYRNDPDFMSAELGQTPSPLDQRRLNRLIDNDATVAQNYRRIASLAVQELYGSDNESKTFGEFRIGTRDALNTQLNKLLPELTLTDLGRPLHKGTFFFTKGISANFPYKNLSGGEKAVFDMLLDILTNRGDYDNTIYAIDEPESHINPRLQGDLLRVLYDMVPENCQLWLATHAIGILRAARDLAVNSPDKVVFLDFDKDFDQPQILQPEVFNRSFWERSLAIAFADMAALIAPRMIVRCEGSSQSKAGDGFDARIYETIFDSEFPDVRFVSSGASNDLKKDISLVTAALEGKIPGLTFKKLFDRDDRSEEERAEMIADGDRVLRRRHIESYLFDDEILAALANLYDQTSKTSEIIAAREVALADAKSRGNPEDHMKAAAGQTYNAIKIILNIRHGGTTARIFMRDVLAPLMTRSMNVYSELKEDIFGKWPALRHYHSGSVVKNSG